MTNRSSLDESLRQLHQQRNPSAIPLAQQIPLPPRAQRRAELARRGTVVPVLAGLGPPSSLPPAARNGAETHAEHALPDLVAFGRGAGFGEYRVAELMLVPGDCGMRPGRRGRQVGEEGN